MYKQISAVLLTGALSVVPVVGVAAAPGYAQIPAAKQKQASAVGTHATRGVVKSVDASTLVITRTGRENGDMTFMLNASTHRDGTVAVGVPVSVRYREEGAKHVATAVLAQQPKQQAAHTPAAAKK
jgi:hypothetical protein